MSLPRKLFARVDELLGKYPLIAITGPRQSGKTTFCHQLRPGFQYLNMELGENRDFARNDPHGFLQAYQGGVILDEVQAVPELFPYLQFYTDQRARKGEYILSGSQHFLLLENITQSLAGRIAIFNLLPFSVEELEGSDWLPKGWEEYLWKGSYPRIYDAGISPPDFYADYLQTYIERDVRSILNVGDLNVFKSFVAACAGRTGQLLNLSQLGNDLGIDGKTAKRWLSVLEASFIAYRLPPYFKNFDKRIVKSPKLYFYDTGLAAYLLGIRSPLDVETHFAKGALFENLAINEILKNHLNRHLRAQAYFWKDSNNREIDLLLDKGKVKEIIEIKAGKTIQPAFFKNLSSFSSFSADPTKAWLIYGGDQTQERTNATVLNWLTINKLPL